MSIIHARAVREVKLNFVNWYLQGIRYEDIVPTVILFGDKIALILVVSINLNTACFYLDKIPC